MRRAHEAAGSSTGQPAAAANAAEGASALVVGALSSPPARREGSTKASAAHLSLGLHRGGQSLRGLLDHDRQLPGALADQEVAAAGARGAGSEAGAQLEPVLERDQPVARAPDDCGGTCHASEVDRGSSRRSALAAPSTSVCSGWAARKPDHGLRREQPRVLRAPVSEHRQAQVRPPGEQTA